MRRIIPEKEVMRLIAHYRDSVSQLQGAHPDTLTLHSTCNISVERRNPTLMLIPSMYAIARGKERRFQVDAITTLSLSQGKVVDSETHLIKGNVPKNREVMTIARQLALPDIYGETIFGGFLLSPLNPYNKGAYRYFVTSLTDQRVEIVFLPKVRNTQLVSGSVIVNQRNGRILSANIRGEIDVVSFELRIWMGHRLIPTEVKSNIKFRFVGNKVTSVNKLHYSPTPLKFDTTRCSSPDTIKEARRETLISKLGNYFVERLRGNFGTRQQGTYKISPLINPLYLSYSSRRGLTYRLKLQAGYQFSDNTSFGLTAKAAYSFRQRQPYISIPTQLKLGTKLKIETRFETGNRITDSEILERIKHEKADSIQWDKMNLQYFRDSRWSLRAKYEFTPRWSLRLGATFHRRTAVDKAAFNMTDKPTRYHSFAPDLQLQIQPWKDQGPIFTLDYERGIKGIFHSRNSYESIEADASWKKTLHRMRTLSTRVGYGIYTSRSHGAYFLDYANFRYENIPGGWDDDWTGEFQLLNSNWYNASRYYLRSNLTYESPLMLLSRLPLVGRYIETERIYANILLTDKLHPYIECGYGMTNKLFSMGAFFSTSNKKIGDVGIRFALELFRDW